MLWTLTDYAQIHDVLNKAGHGDRVEVVREGRRVATYRLEQIWGTCSLAVLLEKQERDYRYEQWLKELPIHKESPVSKGIMHKQDGVEAETMICCLVDLPRTKLHLIEFKNSDAHHLLLRKIKFLAPENVRGSDIKIGLPEARQLVEALNHFLNSQADRG